MSTAPAALLALSLPRAVPGQSSSSSRPPLANAVACTCIALWEPRRPQLLRTGLTPSYWSGFTAGPPPLGHGQVGEGHSRTLVTLPSSAPPLCLCTCRPLALSATEPQPVPSYSPGWVWQLSGLRWFRPPTSTDQESGTEAARWAPVVAPASLDPGEQFMHVTQPPKTLLAQVWNGVYDLCEESMKITNRDPVA